MHTLTTIVYVPALSKYLVHTHQFAEKGEYKVERFSIKKRKDGWFICTCETFKINLYCYDCIWQLGVPLLLGWVVHRYCNQVDGRPLRKLHCFLCFTTSKSTISFL